jgi:thioredoxin 2
MDSLIVACANCAGLNRIPAARLYDNPRCGKCRQTVFQGHPVALSAQNFEAHAVRSDIPVLIDFWAPWCQPCRMMAPAFEAAAARMEPQFRLAKIDTEAEPDLGARFAIRSIPTLVLLHRGQTLARHSGAIGSDDIERFARQAFADYASS